MLKRIITRLRHLFAKYRVLEEVSVYYPQKRFLLFWYMTMVERNIWGDPCIVWKHTPDAAWEYIEFMTRKSKVKSPPTSTTHYRRSSW